MRPPGPEPDMTVRSTPRSLATLRASGDALMRSPGWGAGAGDGWGFAVSVGALAAGSGAFGSGAFDSGAGLGLGPSDGPAIPEMSSSAAAITATSLPTST